ncbi:MAG: polyprenyl synthetase family protein [Gammaproteobacteria bacterium]|nr:polyprenyl synthetase family protein [Gammaproteobacteria bacterium]MCY4357951.1 polyprenyl synthetase family protein [Gammaproteobacteria bacterium]
MIQKLRSVVDADFAAVNDYIVSQLHSEVDLVENIGHYIVGAGGKRMRPLLVLLAARACGVTSRHHIAMAAVIEFIHTATLLHDDVVDMSTLRRGRPTVNAQWNTPSSVLVGDFIYSRAFQILVRIGDMRIMDIMANTTNKIAEGEVLQLIAKVNPDSTEADYMRVIEHKTAILFEAAGQCGAILGQPADQHVDSLKQYGRHLGVAFQLVDDVLDYAGDTESLGKNVGDDLAEGKATLPLIHAMAHATADETSLIRNCLIQKSANPEKLKRVIQIVGSNGALDYTRSLAEEQADKARSCLIALPDSSYRQTLFDLVDFALSRHS